LSVSLLLISLRLLLCPIAVAEKLRKKRKLFNVDTLLEPEGLQKVYESFPLIAWDRRENCETKALTQIVSMYKNWLFHLFPKMSFTLLVDRLEKLGSKHTLKELLQDLRYGDQPEWERFHSGMDEEKKEEHKAQLTGAAAEIFNAYTATLQPIVKKSIHTVEPDDLIDNEDGEDDALFAALADKYSTKSADGSSDNIHALLARKKADEAAKAKAKAEEQAALEKKLEQEQIEMEIAYKAQEEAEAMTGGAGPAQPQRKKQRRVISDDEDEAEAEMQPNAASSSSAAAAAANAEGESSQGLQASQEEVLETDEPRMETSDQAALTTTGAAAAASNESEVPATEHSEDVVMEEPTNADATREDARATSPRAASSAAFPLLIGETASADPAPLETSSQEEAESEVANGVTDASLSLDTPLRSSNARMVDDDGEDLPLETDAHDEDHTMAEPNQTAATGEAESAESGPEGQKRTFSPSGFLAEE
jgi:hypothetical protein